MIVRIVLISLLSMVSLFSSAQDRIKLISIETGINFIESESTDTERIRASYSEYYSYGFNSGDLRAQMSRVYIGVKAEARSLNNFLSLATGLRYSQVTNSISKEYSPAYFYYLFRQSGTTTEYLRIKTINQVTGYVSIPLEVRVFPYRERKFRLYFLAGTEFGFRIATSNKIEFHEASMDQYESEVSAIIEEPGSFCTTIYGRGGFIIGGEKPFLDIGITLPFGISGSASTMSDPGVGGGFHLQVLKKF